MDNLLPIYTKNSLFPLKDKYYLKLLCNVPAAYLITIYNQPRKTGDKSLDTYIEENIDVLAHSTDENVVEKRFCAKFRYDSQEAAVHFLNQVKEVEQGHKKPVRAYKCDKCALWHVTSRPNVLHVLKFNHPVGFGKYEGQLFTRKLYESDESYWQFLEDENIATYPFTAKNKVRKVYPKAVIRKQVSLDNVQYVISDLLTGNILGSSYTYITAWEITLLNIQKKLK